MKRPWGFYVGAVLVVTSGYGPRTAWHDCTYMVSSNNSQDSVGTPFDFRAGIVRPHTGIFNVFHTLTLTLKHWHNPTKIPCERRIWPCGARKGLLLSRHGLFTGCLQYLNAYGARKRIMHALKLYGSRAWKQNSHGAVRAPWVDVQTMNKPRSSRMGPGSVM